MKYLAIIALAFLSACGGNDVNNADAAEPKKDEPLSKSKNSEIFNTQFTSLLDSYFHLKDALVLTNDNMAVTSAGLLQKAADSLKLSEIKADESIVENAKGFVESISAEAKALVGAKDIEEKRKSFQMISDNMYNLVRTVQYDRQVVYHQYCPMAFNDQGADWLSQTADIKNPYFGKKMLTCGEVKDSIDYRGK
jgi:Cu(I)/Ag(I) efflux system membrane fusion protein